MDQNVAASGTAPDADYTNGAPSHWLIGNPLAAAHAFLKLECIMKVMTELLSSGGERLSIPRRTNLSREEFEEKYYFSNRPVVIQDLFTNARALTLWTPQYFKEQFGKEIVQIVSNRLSDRRFELHEESLFGEILFEEFIDRIQAGGETNDYYLVGRNELLARPAFASLYEDFSIPSYLNPATLRGNAFLWFGPKGTVTPLHHDTCNVLFFQVYGNKRLKLIAPEFTPRLYNGISVFSEVDAEDPDYNRHPAFRGVTVLETVLHPGDALFLPVCWWHHVRACEVSMTLTFNNFRASSNKFEYPELLVPDARSQEIIRA